MLKIKQIIVIFVFLIGLSSCGEFTKVLNKGNSIEQYTLATELYKAGKFNKSIQLFEKVIPAYRGKPQMERIQFMLSDAYYQTKNYLLAAYHFDRFTKNYPKSTKKETASFMSAHSYYLSIPRASLDQSDTKTAIDSFQKFIDTYPNSNKITQANEYVKEMQLRLEQKAFDIAYQYYHTEHFKAAVIAFDIFLTDNLGSVFKEDALFYRSKSAYEVAIRSIESKKEIRIKEALKSLKRLEYSFKDTKYKNKIEKLRSTLKTELIKTTANNKLTDGF
jgi:outer membrane protein assembly factor BamD